jgi:hypothetical protein
MDVDLGVSRRHMQHHIPFWTVYCNQGQDRCLSSAVDRRLKRSCPILALTRDPKSREVVRLDKKADILLQMLKAYLIQGGVRELVEVLSYHELCERLRLQLPFLYEVVDDCCDPILISYSPFFLCVREATEPKEMMQLWELLLGKTCQIIWIQAKSRHTYPCLTFMPFFEFSGYNGHRVLQIGVWHTP